MAALIVFVPLYEMHQGSRYHNPVLRSPTIQRTHVVAWSTGSVDSCSVTMSAPKVSRTAWLFSWGTTTSYGAMF